MNLGTSMNTSHDSRLATFVAIIVALSAATARGQSLEDGVEDGGADQPVLQPADVPPDRALLEGGDALPSTGRAILEACRSRIQAAHAITFHARNYATDSLKSMSPDVFADVRMLKPAGMSTWIVRSTGSGAAKGGGPEVQFDVAWLALTSEYVDHEAKKLVEKRHRDARSPFYQVAVGTKIDDLASPNPLAKPLGAVEITLEPRAVVGGVECDVVRVSMTAGGKNVSLWSIGAEDHFPRKIEKIVQSSMFSGSMVTELTDVVISDDPSSLRAELLRVAVPAGYEEDRPAAPVQPTLVPGISEDVKTPPEGTAAPGSDAAPPEGEPPAAATAPSAPALPTRLPDFELTDAEGNTVSNSTLAGKTGVLVFYGAWSLPARQSLSPIEAAIRPHAASIRAYGVSVRDKELTNAVNVARNAGFTAPVLGSGDGLARAAQIGVYPAVLLVDAEGRIAYRFEGVRTPDDVTPIAVALASMTGVGLPEGTGTPKGD